ncbi:hypothetical protein JB92DRAFT_2832860 [Gautieria morchelliformis]|nr:hypothetical protein JB92DRAFT_2832860 [Gautieria morchelliformis]
MTFDFDTVQHEARVHATLMSIGFIILLPVGILIPRYARTFTNNWFYFHVAFQFFIAGPIIMAGFAMGYMAVQQTVSLGGVTNWSDAHMKMGLAIFILYFVQITLGLFSHLIKFPSSRFLFHRSPQQLLHIALGLAIIGMSFYQVRLGYQVEWITFIQTIPPPSVNRAWMALVIVMPILYVLGFAFIPRQISQEAATRENRRNGFKEAA